MGIFYAIYLNKSRLKLRDSKLLAEELALCPFFLYKAHIEVGGGVERHREKEEERER